MSEQKKSHEGTSKSFLKPEELDELFEALESLHKSPEPDRFRKLQNRKKDALITMFKSKRRKAYTFKKAAKKTQPEKMDSSNTSLPQWLQLLLEKGSSDDNAKA